MTSNMPSAHYKPDLLSLPDDLFIAIARWLEDWDVWKLELVNKRLHNVLSNSSFNWPYKRQFSVLFVIPGRLRWLLKRIKRYSHISWSKNVAVMPGGMGDLSMRSSNCVEPPMLSCFPAECAPSAQLSLSVQPDQGEKMLALGSGNIALGADHHLSSFWDNLKQHLTVLTLDTSLETSKTHHWKNLGMLTALQKLKITHDAPLKQNSSQPYLNLSGERLAWSLSHLNSLHIEGVEQGTFVLSCPRLAEAWFEKIKGVSIKVEVAALNNLQLLDCKGINFAGSSHQHMVKSLIKLSVVGCNEVGRHLIEDVGRMTQLQSLEYYHFPAASMPRSFPQSLKDISLHPVDWSGNLPRDLDTLYNLEVFELLIECKSWDLTRPLAELLSLDKVTRVRLGSTVYRRQEDEGKGFKKHIDRLIVV